MKVELEHIRQSQMDLSEIVMEELRSLGVGNTDTFLVAVSGGADSTALLLAMERGLGGPDRLTACYVDHGIRGDSVRDREMVTSLCRSAGVELVTGSLDPLEISHFRRRHGSLEAGMRILRYRFLRQAAEERSSKWVVTGHTADDQAETVLFRVARGMDWRSMGGIPAKRGMILRPLLGVGRNTTRSYCDSRGITPVTDSTNFDESYARNRIRIRIIPGLENRFHNRISTLLRRFGHAAQRLSSLEEGFLKLMLYDQDVEVPDIIDGKLLPGIPPVFRKRLILDHMMRTLPEFPSRRLLERAQEFILANRNGRLSLTGPFALILSYGKARVVEDLPVKAEHLPSDGLELKVPGRVVLPVTNIAIVACEGTLVTPGAYPRGRSVLLSKRNLQEPLSVRMRRPGDRFRPMGMNNSKKLKNFLVDRKIPAAIRDSIPIVVDGKGEILWVAGWEISQAAALEGIEGEEAILLSMEDPCDVPEAGSS